MQQLAEQCRFIDRAVAGGFFFEQAQGVDVVFGLVQADVRLCR